MTAIIETRRLRLTPLRARHADDLLALVTEAWVRRFLFDNQRLDADDIVEMIARSERLHTERGAGGWAVHAHDEEAMAGAFWLWPFQDPQRLELAFALSSRWRGRGYAMEAGDALLTHLRDELRWPRVHASTDIGNGASIRTLWRLGFKETGLSAGPTGPLRLFSCEFNADSAATRERWTQAHAQPAPDREPAGRRRRTDSYPANVTEPV